MPRPAEQFPDPRPTYQALVAVNPSASVDIGDRERRKIPHPDAVESVNGIALYTRGPRVGRYRPALEIGARLRSWISANEAMTRQLTDNPLWAAHRSRAARPHRFRAAPANIFKTIQRWGTPGHFRLVIPDTTDVRNIVHLGIDPSRVTDNMFLVLDIEDSMPPRDGSLLAEERVAAIGEMMPEILEAFLKLEPIETDFPDNGSYSSADGDALHALQGAKYTRLMRMGQGQYEGDIVGHHEHQGRLVFFRTDLQNAYLHELHILSNNTDEVRTLSGIAVILDTVEDMIVNNWNEVRKSPEKLQIIRDELFAAIDLLGEVEDKHKVRMKRDIEKAVSLRDRTGRYNPRYAAYAIGRAIQNTQRRMTSISRIRGNISQDYGRLEYLKSVQEKPVRDFVDTVDKWSAQIHLANSSIQIGPDQMAALQAGLDTVNGQFRAVTPGGADDQHIGIFPPERFRQRCLEVIDELRVAIASDDADAIQGKFAQINSMALSRVPNSCRAAFISLRRLTPEQEFDAVPDTDRSHVIANLDKVESRLAKLNYNPYKQFAAAVIPHIQTARAAISEATEDPALASEAFAISYILSKMIRANIDLLELYEKISLDPDSHSPYSLLTDVAKIEDRLASRKLAPNLRNSDFTPAYVKLYRLFTDIKLELEVLGYELIQPEAVGPTADKDSDGVKKPRSIETIINRILDNPALGNFHGRLRNRVRGMLSASWKVPTIRETITSAMEGVRSRIDSLVGRSEANSVGPVENAAEPYLKPRKQISLDDQREAYARIKERIRDFDFPSLFQTEQVA